MDMTIRTIALPLLSLVEEVFGVSQVQVCGDNQAMLIVMKTGRNPTMRHLSRTHRVSVAWLHEQYQRENFVFSYVTSSDMAADIFTKPISQPDVWSHARKKINVFGDLSELTQHVLHQRQVHSMHDSRVSCAFVAVSDSTVGDTPRFLAESFIHPRAPAMNCGPHPVVTQGRTHTSTLGRIYNIVRQVLEPQQVDPQAVTVPQFSEVASSAQQLCQKYDLYPLVDLQELTKAVVASGGDPSGPSAASSSGGDPSGEAVGRRIDPPWKVTVMSDSTWWWKTSKRVQKKGKSSLGAQTGILAEEKYGYWRL